MSFLLTCPTCGPRDAYEFRYGGEVRRRPQPGSSPEEWADYLYFRANVAGDERAWWFHKDGCRRWLEAERDTRDNRVISTAWPDPVADPTESDHGHSEPAS
jgi:sarcosine oxidase subunit delta